MASFAVVLVVAIASVAGVMLGTAGLYGEPVRALGPTPSAAGILVPGLLGHDVFNLVVGAPLLAAVVWLALRGSLVAALLWPGTLFYVLYTFAIYLLGAPFSGMFPVYVVLVASSGFTTVALLVKFAGAVGRDQIAPSAPVRLVGGLLVALALVTVAQDLSGAVGTALMGRAPTDPLARPVWAVDLSIEVPAVLLGGVLLWRRRPLGFLAAPGLLLQYGLTPVALAFGLVMQAVFTGSGVEWGSVIGVLAFAVVCFAPLVLLLRAEAGESDDSRRSPRLPAAAPGANRGGRQLEQRARSASAVAEKS